MDIKDFLTLFFLENPKYILEPDISEIVQRSSEWAASPEIEKLIENTDFSCSNEEYQNALIESGWLGNARSPRYEMKNKIINTIHRISKFARNKYSATEAKLITNAINYIIEYETALFKIENATQDDGFIQTPNLLNYKKWVEKEKTLKGRIAFNNFLLFLERKNIIKIEPINRNILSLYNIEFFPHNLTIKFGMEGEVKEKAEELIRNAKGNLQHRNDLEKITHALNIELEKTKNHIKWLEEEIDFPTEIFEQAKSSNKNQKISTRKLAVSSS